MNERIDEMLSDWFDDAEAKPDGASDAIVIESREMVAESLLVHGFLSDVGCRDDEREAERIRALMQRIDTESPMPESSASVANVGKTLGDSSWARKLMASSAAALTLAAAVMVMFVVLSPGQNVSAAMASLEKVVEAAAKPFDRTYSVRVVEEYPRDRRPRNLAQQAWQREAEAEIDGATLYVRGANQYVLTVLLPTGLKRTSGCDGQQSWAFREDGPVQVSADLSRFRGGLPGQQQDIPFINIHSHLTQLRDGYDVQLSEQQDHASDGSVVSQLIGVRKSRDVRGPKQIQIWFDSRSGTVHKMLLDGLPRGRGGPKSLALELIDESELAPRFFSHKSHHEPGRRVRDEDEQP